MSLTAIFSLILILLLILAYRFYKCLPDFNPKKRTENKPIDVLVVLGSGGHTGEMAPLVNALHKSENYKSFTFISANTDKLSQQHPLIPKENATFKSIPRARNVGQSFFTSIFTTIYSFIAALPLMFLKPQLLLVNGPGVCFPVVLSIFIGNVLGVTNCSIVFVESICRVESLSLTGKMIYPICDMFFVHWPRLLPLKKRAQIIDLFSLHKNK
ncbi:hypothetical protein TRFO_21846 [Tritrichomonas foetus]|uniref:UDP-N-acetylglucosamine transferase subunit ALG14 n=1 Tax=Tritrichomonas foetus TaxID=1144522 RepID=A0A1J4KED5_9EUKA|nr:hypothetical protein TRFO_21846 [Tritrichomonas foetus]|eukprot:OHT09280.1 hypothetical protein TRFO_21846 [Tritrichomonas foetus]